MTARLALYTFGVFALPSKEPENDAFHSLNDQILAQVDRAFGLVGRSGYDNEPGPKSWGVQVFPKFFVDNGDGWSPSTLSVWENIESAMAFSYFGLHAEALKRGTEWFERPKWPPYAAWWLLKDDLPDWAEGVRRHQHLHENGPTSIAFNFKKAFDPAGNLLAIDSAKVRLIASQNSLIFANSK